ncbi:hypothetical protein [Paenibacillus thermotolerans]|uniref:hypothetical protein n=1 Tax=Paenibacillus thermotolerans TaxID=3027807 RepID=UPI002368E221|nr:MULTISPECIES: hypothetical protein [unclassified Paenibacillus]
MVDVREVCFRRMGYSGNERVAEVEVRSSEFPQPLVATFKQDNNGALRLINVAAVDERLDLDWYDNNLHTAYSSVDAQLFVQPGGEERRKKFAADVLAFGETEEMLQDKFYYGE